MPITALYAGLLAPLFVLLALRVILQRTKQRVAVGDGQNLKLLRLIRVHGNFAEYVPLALVLMALAESLGAWAWLLHVLGIALVAGRSLHAYGVSQVKEVLRYRQMGMALTFGVLISGALACLVLSVTQS